MERAGNGGFDLRVIDAMRREIHPGRDWSSYRQFCVCSVKSGGHRPHAQLEGGHSGTCCGHGTRYSRGPHDSRSRVSLRSKPDRSPHLSACREMGRPSLPEVHQRLRRHDKPVRLRRHRPTRSIRHGVQRHGSGTVSRSSPVSRDVRREFGLQPEHVVIGKVARLFHLKGHEFILKAAPSVIAANPNVRFLFVGDGICVPTSNIRSRNSV